ncbi:hypothetical protein HJG60_011369 [Phyllostomus discolor]|uniref:Uncharacterized protein n=1 Tax=Phyllostomus discolor TaxID=89673 RepID=A0A834A2S0_9CHIR|nr:hypothetical protein HJG60_011369 [Phyllostomus discolor]
MLAKTWHQILTRCRRRAVCLSHGGGLVSFLYLFIFLPRAGMLPSFTRKAIKLIFNLKSQHFKIYEIMRQREGALTRRKASSAANCAAGRPRAGPQPRRASQRTEHSADLFEADPVAPWETAGHSWRPETRGGLPGTLVKAVGSLPGASFHIKP